MSSVGYRYELSAVCLPCKHDMEIGICILKYRVALFIRRFHQFIIDLRISVAILIVNRLFILGDLECAVAHEEIFFGLSPLLYELLYYLGSAVFPSRQFCLLHMFRRLFRRLCRYDGQFLKEQGDADKNSDYS